MNIRGLTWLGTRTDAAADLERFYEEVLGLSAVSRRPGQSVYALPDGSVVEVFGPQDPDHPHFDTGPVVGFDVADIEAAASELAAAQIELIGPVGGRPGEWRWQHFRAPDGAVYELTQRPAG